jgi:hypothetical protein
MNYFYALLIFLYVAAFMPSSAMAQCDADSTSIYGFNDPNGSGAYSGYLCDGTDSVGTFGVYGYYNGDGYEIKLVAGSQITFSTDSCTGHNASITINDSTYHQIPGAYSAPACPNSLNFTAPYTGRYIVLLNKNGNCGVSGTSLIGQVYAQIQQGTIVPPCPDSYFVNDTICGAVELTLNTFVHGNSSFASPTDPMDGYVVSLGDSCSPPNNTLWYSFSSPVTIDTVHIWLTSDAGSNFHSWLIGFVANHPNNACTGGLSFLGCANGPDESAGIDTVDIPLYGILAGQVYIFMIDGFNGGSGGFSIAVMNSSFTGIAESLDDKNFSIYPNPVNDILKIMSMINQPVNVRISNSEGRAVLERSFENLIDEEITLKSLSPGFYTLTIYNSVNSYHKKLMILGEK